MWLPILVTVLTGYLLGNLNGAVSMSTLLSHDDIRSHGSGNAGLTNFMRTFGAGSAVLVVIIDALKAVLACFVGKLVLQPYGYASEGMVLGAVAVSLGHDFPALLGFRGGKGILCGFAVAWVMDWRCALVVGIVFAVGAVVTRYVSLGSVLGAVSYCISFCVFHYSDPWMAAGGVLIGLLALYMHRGNIVRLCKGTEPKFSLGKGKNKSAK